MNISIFIILAALLAPAVALAATDNEKFEKLLGKATVADLDDIQKAKAACVCREAALTLRAGVLVRAFFTGQWIVRCFIPTFDSNGSVSTNNNPQPCDDWELLTK